MTPVTPYLSRYALALAAGAAAATLLVALAPGAYYDIVELRLFDLHDGSVTLHRVLDEGLMAGFFFLVGKEAWEALTRERGGLSGRRAILPLAGAAGGMVGAAGLWLALAALAGPDGAEAGMPGWIAPLGTDVVLAVAAGRLVFGTGHPALQVLLLLAAADNLTGLLLSGLLAPDASLRPLWLVVPLVASLCGWALLTRPAMRTGARERDRLRAGRLTPWIALAALSWAGIAASGLPPALGALPLLPAMPAAARSFGLFAQAEDFLTDPMNRLARLLHRPLLPVMALFGFVHGGIDTAALAPMTGVALAAAALGKPLGTGLAMLAGVRFAALPLPAGLSPRDLPALAALGAICLTLPAMALDRVLPGGEVAEAARAGFALAVIAGFTIVPLLRLWRRA